MGSPVRIRLVHLLHPSFRDGSFIFFKKILKSDVHERGHRLRFLHSAAVSRIIYIQMESRVAEFQVSPPLLLDRVMLLRRYRTEAQ